MASGRYLRRRAHTWFFRFRWPAALAGCRVSGELGVSLGTGDYRLALHRARLLRLQAEYIMARFTPTTTKAEAETAVRGWVDRCLWRQETHCAETGGIALLDTAEIETMGRQDAAELGRPPMGGGGRRRRVSPLWRGQDKVTTKLLAGRGCPAVGGPADAAAVVVRLGDGRSDTKRAGVSHCAGKHFIYRQCRKAS
jgi:hypothetical protein